MESPFISNRRACQGFFTRCVEWQLASAHYKAQLPSRAIAFPPVRKKSVCVTGRADISGKYVFRGKPRVKQLGSVSGGEIKHPFPLFFTSGEEKLSAPLVVEVMENSFINLVATGTYGGAYNSHDV